MVHYRSFRNTDPPVLVKVWNEVFAGRGAVHLPNSTPLEYCVFAKPYFDPAGLVVAEEDGVCLGFAHAGFGADATGRALCYQDGVVCFIGVRPDFRKRGIGSNLLARCEAYLREKGAQTLFAGPHRLRNPFYLGLYGGSNLPGFLTNQGEVEPFLAKHQYQVCRETLVLQRGLRQPLKLFDARYAAHRQQYELGAGVPRSYPSWWQECVLNPLEPDEFCLKDKATGTRVAVALVWEMPNLGGRGPMPAVGIVDLEIVQSKRRLGLGKFFLALIVRTLQDQYFETAEIQVDLENTAAVKLCRGLGFEQVDVGRAYKKDVS